MNYLLSKPNKIVLIPHNDQIEAMWPQVKRLPYNGGVYALIPHTPTDQIKLRSLDIEVPAPVLSHYDWCGGTPFQTQKITAALLTSSRRAYVLSDMGTGKTKAALWSWHYLYTHGWAGKLLVVGPLSTLKFVWLSEVLKTLPGVKAVVLHGSRAERLRRLQDDKFDIYIINHDGLKTIATQLYARTDIDTLVLDELAVYRNNSQRSKQMREFAQRFVWAWGMTGRPMPNEPTDVWAQCKILTPDRVPKYFRHARSQLMLQVTPYKWVPRSEAVPTAYNWMQPAVRFLLDDVVELPDAIHRTVDVELTPQQTMIYRKLSNELAVMVDNKVINAANAGVAMGKLLQIGAGYVYSNNPLGVALQSDPRKQALLDIIEQAEHQLLVFAPWRHLIDGLSALLTDNKISHATVHGDTPRREQIFSDFQNPDSYTKPKLRVLLAHPACVHHGLTLTAATTIVWYSPVTSLEVYEQANARIRRVGQQHKQLYFHLQATAVERKIYSMLRGKQKLQDKFLDMIQTASTEE